MERQALLAKIDELIEKINHFNTNILRKKQGEMASIEKDLLLGHLRELYDHVLSLNHTAVKEEKTAEIQPVEQKTEKEIPKTEERKPASTPAQPVISKEEKQVAPTAAPKITSPAKEVMEEVPKVVEKKEEQAKKTSASVKAEMNLRTPPGSASLNEKFKKDTAHLGEKLAGKPVADLRAVIGVNQRFGFINELFGKNAAEFDTALRHLNGCKSHEEATAFINSQLKAKHKWEEKNPAVKEFMDLVRRRFLKS